MGAVALAFRADVRHRWRSWLAVAVLISIAGAIVLAATAAGHRTENAFPQFVSAHGFDAVVYTLPPVPEVAKLPGVVSATDMIGLDNGRPTCACSHPINPNNFGIFQIPLNGSSPFILVSGRMPNASDPHQVLASFTLRQDEGIHLGSVIEIPFFSPSQAAAYNTTPTSLLRPRGPTFAFRVVGFEATEFEFPSGGTPSYDLYATSAFARIEKGRIGLGHAYLVRLRHGAADLPRFDTAVSHLPAAGVGGYYNEDTQADSVETSIRPQAIGWWILAALSGLVGLAVVGQALARQSAAESEDYPTMAALGADRRQLAALGMIRNLVLGVAGAVSAVAIATVLSPLAPLGEARSAESSTGIAFDVPVLLLGALSIIAVVFALGIWPALRATRTLRRSEDQPPTSRPSAVAGYLAGMGAAPTAVVGVRSALERRSGGASIPVGTALLGTVLAVIALCGTAVFGASLSHLTSTPKLYGDPFQLNISSASAGGAPDPALLKELEHNRAITRITAGLAPPEVSVNNVPVSAIAGTAIRGPLLLSTVAGHAPNGDYQIGLGATTMRQVGAHLGSIVRVTVSLPSGGKRTVHFRVVSQISFPVLGGGIVSLGNGAVFTIRGYEAAVCPPGKQQSACQKATARTMSGGGLLVGVIGGARGQAAINHLLRRYGGSAALAITPISLINFGEAVNFPLIFGAILALFGAATLAHLLAVSVSRRRREIGLLKVLGFVNRQVGATVSWQATTVALIGIVAGVPLGVVTGRAVWIAFANNLGAVPVSVVPSSVIVLMVTGVVVVANLIAVVPAIVATHSTPAELLRTS